MNRDRHPVLRGRRSRDVRDRTPGDGPRRPGDRAPSTRSCRPACVLDVGAGDGFTAERLGAGRTIVALEPCAGMIGERTCCGGSGVRPSTSRSRCVVRRRLRDVGVLLLAGLGPDAGDRGARPGRAARRTARDRRQPRWRRVRRDGRRRTSAPTPRAGQRRGSRRDVIETAFRFDDLDEARAPARLLLRRRGVAGAALEVPFRVGLFTIRASALDPARRAAHHARDMRMP